MEKRNRTAAGESLAVVKAAAWAWYQHGSGGKSPTESEYAVTRTFRTHGPSRFKRQLKIRVLCEDDKTVTESMPATLNSSNSVGHSSGLLDEYEIKRISNQIDFLTGSSTGGKFFGTNMGLRRSLSSPGNGALQRKKTEKRYEMKFLGIKIRSHGVICGGLRNDVVEPTVFEGGRLRPEKHEAIVSRRRQ